MTVETATYISDLNATYPAEGDDIGEGNDHIKLVKSTVKATFPNVSGAVTPTHTELNYVDGVTGAIQTQLDAKAPSNSPTLVTPNIGTPSAGTLTNCTGLPLTTGVTGTMPVANGGTGATTHTANAVLIGNGTSALQSVAPGTSGNVLTSNGTAWTSAAPTGSAGAWTFVSSQTASASSSITFSSLSSGYDYLIEIDGLYLSASNTLRARLLNSGVEDTAANYPIDASLVNSSSVTGYSSTVIGALQFGNIAFAGTSSERQSLRIDFPNLCAGGYAGRPIYFEGRVYNSGWYKLDGSSSYLSTSTVDGIKIFPAAGSITAGTFNLYKRARS